MRSRVYIEHNPYLQETFIEIDGESVHQDSRLASMNRPFIPQKLIPAITEELNYQDVEIIFAGNRVDCELLRSCCTEYNSLGASHITVTTIENPGVTEAAGVIRGLVQQMIRNAPLDLVYTSVLQDLNHQLEEAIQDGDSHNMSCILARSHDLLIGSVPKLVQTIGKAKESLNEKLLGVQYDKGEEARLKATQKNLSTLELRMDSTQLDVRPLVFSPRLFEAELCRIDSSLNGGSDLPLLLSVIYERLMERQEDLLQQITTLCQSAFLPFRAIEAELSLYAQTTGVGVSIVPFNTGDLSAKPLALPDLLLMRKQMDELKPTSASQAFDLIVSPLNAMWEHQIESLVGMVLAAEKAVRAHLQKEFDLLRKAIDTSINRQSFMRAEAERLSSDIKEQIIKIELVESIKDRWCEALSFGYRKRLTARGGDVDEWKSIS